MPRPASSSSSSLFYAACIQLFALRWCVCDGLSIKTTTYFDDVCSQPTGAMTHAYGNLHVDDDGFTTLEPFNECVVEKGAGSITVCDVETAENGNVLFADSSCSLLSIDATTSADCISIATGIDFDCDGNNECAHRDRCTGEVASGIVANAYNVLATEYNDANCTSPTDHTRVVAGNLFLEGPNDGSCYQLSAGSTFTKRRCRDDGSVREQTFASNDTTCSGSVWAQTTSATVSDACHTVQEGGFFYSYMSCTLDAAEVTIGGTLAPAQTPAPTSSKAPVQTREPSPPPPSAAPTVLGGEDADAQDTGGAARGGGGGGRGAGGGRVLLWSWVVAVMGVVGGAACGSV